MGGGILGMDRASAQTRALTPRRGHPHVRSRRVYGATLASDSLLRPRRIRLWRRNSRRGFRRSTDMRSQSFSNATFFIFLLRVGKPKSMADCKSDVSESYKERGRFPARRRTIDDCRQAAISVSSLSVHFGSLSRLRRETSREGEQRAVMSGPSDR